MFDQSFSVSDIPKVFILAFLEIVLSADNAVVLGVIVSKLEKHLRKKAFFIGYLSAFFIRAIALLTLGLLIQYQWVQIIGAMYLLYLAIVFFLKKKKPFSQFGGGHGFWKTIVLIELFDIVFALDSILAGLAFISTRDTQLFYSKIWIVYVGGMIGLLAIRYTANLFSYFLEKFPKMERSAHLMIGLIALTLIYELVPHPTLS